MCIYNGVAYCGKKAKEGLGFSKTSVKTAINLLIGNCYFNVANVTMKYEIGIPRRIDPAPFWENLFFYSYKEEYMSSLISFEQIKAKYYNSTTLFIDDLWAINDGWEFERSIC